MKLLAWISLLSHLFSVSQVQTVPDIENQVMEWQSSEAISLIAHDYLAGSYFYSLDLGDTITLLYNGGVSERWVVIDIYIMDNQTQWADTYFKYHHPNNLVLQTCYNLDGNLLIIAQKELR